MKIDLKVEIDEAKKSLSDLDLKSPSIAKKIVSQVATKVKSVVKKSYKGILKKGSGALYGSIIKAIGKGKMVAYVYPIATNEKTKTRYGFVLAAGANILPKNGDYLTFKIGEKWIKSKGVVLPSRDFIENPGEAYLESGEYKALVEKITQKEITRIMEKNNV